MHVHVLGTKGKNKFITLMSYVASRLILPFQVIFFGKTKLSLPPRNHGRILCFSMGWILKYSYNHPMNLQICKDFLTNDLKPYKRVVSFTHETKDGLVD